jgi:hypothetical protein
VHLHRTRPDRINQTSWLRLSNLQAPPNPGNSPHPANWRNRIRAVRTRRDNRSQFRIVLNRAWPKTAQSQQYKARTQ